MSWRLVVLVGKGHGDSADIDERGVVVGRGKKCDLSLEDPLVSRPHCRVVSTGTEVVVTDLESSNGTFVDGMRIEEPTVLPWRAELEVGSTVLVLMAEDERVDTTVGKYQLLGLIGEGGMGSVYLARQLRLDRIVALKMLSRSRAELSQYRRRFQHEWRAAANVDHENILGVRDGDEIGGDYYLEMPYVRGTDLQTVVEREGPLSRERTLHILRHVAAGLDKVHSAAGLVHRDVKPANILVANGRGSEARDHAYVCDFGISKNAATTASGITPSDKVVGSVHYMAPEQLRNETVDSSTDIYALGCVTYTCLTGAPPFLGTYIAIAYGHVEMARPLVSQRRPDLPRAVDIVAAKAIAISKDDRYETCIAFVEALEVALTEESRPEPEPEPKPKAKAKADVWPFRRPSRESEGKSTRIGRVLVLIGIFLALASLGWVVATIDGSGEGLRETEVPAAHDAGEETARDEVESRSPPAIASLTFDRPNAVQIQLIWAATGDVSEFVVYRDGLRRKALGPTAVTYRDKVRPNRRYRYTLVARSTFGPSDRRTITPRSRKLPPVGSARLAGQWRIKETYVAENFDQVDEGDSENWSHGFYPKCPTGACDTRMKLWNLPKLRFGLVRSGRSYRGGTFAPYDRCSGQTVSTEFRVKVWVTRARYIAGRWRATQLRGELRRSWAVGSCRGLGASEKLWGRLDA